MGKSATGGGPSSRKLGVLLDQVQVCSHCYAEAQLIIGDLQHYLMPTVGVLLKDARLVAGIRQLLLVGIAPSHDMPMVACDVSLDCMGLIA